MLETIGQIISKYFISGWLTRFWDFTQTAESPTPRDDWNGDFMLISLTEIKAVELTTKVQTGDHEHLISFSTFAEFVTVDTDSEKDSLIISSCLCVNF